MYDQKIKNRLKKLLVLAAQGVEGEKINAEELLKKLLAKYDLKITDLYDNDEREYYEFRYKTKMESQILLMLYCRIRPKAKTFYHSKEKKLIGLELSKSEYVDLKLHWEAYRKELKRQLEITFLAFIDSQNLWIKVSEEQRDKYTQDPREDLDKWRQIYQRSSSMDKCQVNKELDYRAEGKS